MVMQCNPWGCLNQAYLVSEEGVTFPIVFIIIQSNGKGAGMGRGPP